MCTFLFPIHIPDGLSRRGYAHLLCGPQLAGLRTSDLAEFGGSILGLVVLAVNLGGGICSCVEHHTAPEGVVPPPFLHLNMGSSVLGCGFLPLPLAG